MRSGRRGSAFTLSELTVSIGILALMMLTAGQVFTLTLSSTGKAKALTEATQSLRLFEDMIRAELKAVDPRNSMMLIQPNSINAYWTREGKELDIDGNLSTGYEHPADPEREDGSGNLLLPRADVLMFFSGAPEQAFAGSGELCSAQVLVYGHAELGELNPVDGSWLVQPESFPTFPQSGTFFATPAETWHLARRSVLLSPAVSGPINGFAGSLDDSAAPGQYAIRDGFVDVVGGASAYTLGDNVDNYNDPNNDQTWVLSQEWYARSRLDPTPPARYASQLGHYLLPGCASFKVEWTLDVNAIDPALAGEPTIYWFDPAGDPVLGGDTLGQLQAIINNTNDPTITAARRSALDQLRNDPVGNLNPGPRHLAARFGTQAVGDALDNGPGSPLDLNGVAPVEFEPVWFDVDPYNPSSGDPDLYFPTALRITVDLVDREGRFERPLRHVMVLPVGG